MFSRPLVRTSIFEKRGFKRMQKVAPQFLQIENPTVEMANIETRKRKRERTSTLEGKIKKIGSAFSTAIFR